MNRVETYSNWSRIDQLDGRDIRAGEFLDITWPDGSESREMARVSASSETAWDHGKPCSIPVRKAYFVLTHRGASVDVPLAGFPARRVA